MIREEAIEFGKMWLEINEDCKDSSTYTFFQMAIKALKQTEEITKFVNELNLEDISSLDVDNMLYCMSSKEIKELIWKMYCFTMNVQYTVK